MTGADFPKKRVNKYRVWKLVIQGLPLAAAATTIFLPLHRLGQQFSVLIVLIWVQAFFIFECLLADK